MREDGYMTKVARVGQEQIEAVAATIASSFADDPIWQWLYGIESTIPHETGVVLARMLVARSAPVDEMHQIDDCGAVALWSAPSNLVGAAIDTLRAEQSAGYARTFAEHVGARIELTGQLSEAMAAHRPEEPHWYLGILGTAPDRQNQGLGGQVLNAMLKRCDEYGVPAFLESSNPRNYGFYRRHGFLETETLTVADSPPLLGFWRQPKP